MTKCNSRPIGKDNWDNKRLENAKSRTFLTRSLVLIGGPECNRPGDRYQKTMCALATIGVMKFIHQ